VVRIQGAGGRIPSAPPVSAQGDHPWSPRCAGLPPPMAPRGVGFSRRPVPISGSAFLSWCPKNGGRAKACGEPWFRDAFDAFERSRAGGPADATAEGGRPTSGAREDDELLGRSGHRDIVVDRSFDALAERLRVDEDDQVELESLR
jgi:hypothetical protein